MLWYKAWLETRSRFIIAIVGCTALCSTWIVELNKINPPHGDVRGLFYLLHAIHGVLAVVWVLSVILLMMGGLLQEYAVGTSLFTLALPVSRFHLMLVRIITGLAQAFLLAIVPWLVMFFVSGSANKTYPLSQIFFHVLLLCSGGIVFAALAVLVSSIVEGQYTAPAVSIGMSVLLVRALKAEKLIPYNPGTFMVGSEHFQRSSGLLSGQFPLLHAAAFCAAAILLLGLSIRVIQQRDF
jgi:ABC-2 type transport system permease protein